jgi:O-antigen/teichoic acid export membrane protein
MNPVGRRVAHGALLMIVLKFVERGIGVVSTIILARLLVPADFGLVAMAMAVYAILELFGTFGFDHALIRNPHADKTHYDTAWTMSVIHGLFSATVLASCAPLVAGFFKEPRLVPIVHMLAVTAAVQGFENIGIMLFRKEMRFGNDFRFYLAKKLVAFVITVALAFAFRSYWALVGGALAGRATGVMLSYVVHPYRPSFTLARAGELFRFSRWILLNGMINYLSSRGPDFLIGRLADARTLGTFRISYEMSNLPTTELMYPIARAAYPAYATVVHDIPALKRAFLGVQGAIIAITLPAGVGIVLLADPFVKALLGFRWVDAIPLIQVLGIYGTLRVFQMTNTAIFNVLGAPYWNTLLNALEALIVLPLLGWGLARGVGLSLAVWAYVLSSAILLPSAAWFISRHLHVSYRERIAVTWRPVVSAVAMGAVVWTALHALGSPVDTAGAVSALALVVPAGALTYASCMLLAWSAVGRPAGAESQLLTLVRDGLRRFRR